MGQVTLRNVITEFNPIKALQRFMNLQIRVFKVDEAAFLFLRLTGHAPFDADYFHYNFLAI